MGGWCYMLQCWDESFYVGSTSHTDVTVREQEHNEGRHLGYTAARRPVKLVWSKWFDDLREAHAMERQLKSWSRAKKLALINGSVETLTQLSKRRAGKPKSAPKLSGRQLADRFHSVERRYSEPAGSRHPEVAAKRQLADRFHSVERRYSEPAGSRHPEVAAKRQLADRFHSVERRYSEPAGSRHPEVAAKRPTKDDT